MVALYLDILDADPAPNVADFPRSSPGRLITMVKRKKDLLKNNYFRRKNLNVFDNL